MVRSWKYFNYSTREVFSIVLVMATSMDAQKIHVEQVSSEGQQRLHGNHVVGEDGPQVAE